MSVATQSVWQLIHGSKCYVRHMIEADYADIATFELGFDHIHSLDKQWVWIAERDGKVVGCLLASPVHGTAMVWRLVTAKDQPFSTLAKLLRTFLRDIRERDCVGIVAILRPNEITEGKLKRIMERAKASAVLTNLTLMGGPIPPEGI